MIKILGVTDEITVCDCCGKKNLKKTIGLELTDGTTVHYGSDCASAALLGKKSRKGAESVARLAGAVSFVRRKKDEWTVDQMHDRLAACAWANVAEKNGRILVWNDAGQVFIDR